MRAVEEGEAEVDHSFTRMMDECLACRACEAACPSGVPFGRMIEAARAQAEPTRTARARGVRRLGLTGLLPPRVLTMDEQVQRVLENLRKQSTDIERDVYLIALQDRNRSLF